MPRAEGVPGSLVSEDSFRPQNTRTNACLLGASCLALGRATRDARALGSIEEAGTATPGITHYSLLPAAHSFAALNLNHFTTIDQRSAAQT